MDDETLKANLLTLYEQAPAGYIFTAPDGTILRANATFRDWIGYAHEELRSHRLQDLLTVAGKIFYENQYFPLLRMQGLVEGVTFDLVRRDGARWPVLISSQLQMDDAEQPVMIVSTVFAAAERRAYEHELLLERRRADQLADVVRASTDAILTCSVEGRIQSWNRSAEHLFGYAASAVEEVPLPDLLPFGSAAEYQDAMRSLLSGEPVSAETVVRRADGTEIDVSVSMAPHRDELGVVTSLSAIIRDISERRAVERLQQEFLAMASHELRTPLVLIQGHAQLMQRSGTYNAATVETIIGQTRRLARLIDDLLIASEIESNRFGVRLVELDVVPLVRSMARQFDGVENRVVVRVPDFPIVIHADRHRLEQALANLLTNAVKYSPQGSEIELEIRDEAAKVVIEVRDHGIGIPPDAIPHLFDRFYRAEDVVETVKGAGLGLYITQQIIAAHGGTIDVTSEVGKGSTFRLRFPLTHDATQVEPVAALSR
ncbi:MAG TPA: ATP-binding protein [Chloroflexota bacterium]|nr:ATP-binding protein [Chloroflexota bacterium]